LCLKKLKLSKGYLGHLSTFHSISKTTFCEPNTDSNSFNRFQSNYVNWTGGQTKQNCIPISSKSNSFYIYHSIQKHSANQALPYTKNVNFCCALMRHLYTLFSSLKSKERGGKGREGEGSLFNYTRSWVGRKGRGGKSF